MGREIKIHEAVLRSILADFAGSDAVRITADGESLAVSDAARCRRVFGSEMAEAGGLLSAVIPAEELGRLVAFLDGGFSPAVLAFGDPFRVVTERGELALKTAAPPPQEADPGRQETFLVPRERLRRELRSLAGDLAVIAFAGNGVVIGSFENFIYTDKSVASNNVSVVSADDLSAELLRHRGDLVALSITDDGILLVEGEERKSGLRQERPILQEVK